MWRIFNGIPRVIKQHFHGPRAATGICKEEDQLRDHVETVENCSWFDRTRRCTSSPPESREEYEEGRGTDHDNDWWRNIHRDWFQFYSRHTALDAVTWGAAVILGIQLSRPRWSDGCIRSSPSNVESLPRRRPSLLCRVAFALPGRPTSLRSIKEKEAAKAAKKNEDLEKRQDATEDLGYREVLKDFEEICKKYVALGKSLLGLRMAGEGNMSEALKHLEEASRYGHTSANFNLGLCYETGRGVEVDLKKAARYYKKAGEDGHAKALYNLALLHLKGEGDIKQDTKLAILLLESAAQSGLMEAQTYMGVYYTEEEQHDMKKAVKFFCQASEQSDPEAQYFLAICHEQGWGVEMNECKAAQLYMLAAQTGHDGAMYNLGVFHEHGLGGLPVDRVSALDFYTKSAAQGNEHAKFKLEEWHAKASIWEWKAENEEREDCGCQKPGVPVISVTAPSLTDYLRENLGQFSIRHTRHTSDPVLVPQKTTLNPMNQPMGRSKSEQVLFYLRDEDLVTEVDSGYGSPVGLTPNCSMAGMCRNATMPDLTRMS